MQRRRLGDRPLLPPTGSSWIAAALASSSVVRTARPVTPTVKLVAVTARDEQEPRPGRLGARRGSRTDSRTARLSAGCPGIAGDRGDGRPPGLIHRPGLRLASALRNAGATARRVRLLPSRRVTQRVRENARGAAVRYWNGPFGRACWRSADRV